MAKVIKLRKGLDVNLKGKAAKETASVECPGEYALCPEDFTGLKPKVVVKEGDSVKAGDALFVDKTHPEVCFVSPVSGTVSLVERGDRRKLLSVRVKCDMKFESKTFKTDGDVKALLMESGIFGMIRQRPYDTVANPNETPKAIHVSAFNSMPLAQDFEYVLNGQEAEFQAGLTALSKIAPVNLGVSSKQSAKALLGAANCEVYVFDGPAPAGNVG
ncbi:MAG: NADH:ubiquinone reductase (Na(+)-transporting) subunit A, partial [Bacteroidaceae bacterium]|nr:NADH:ubiquinone reductase (Na(+)-transporting) subunit A [Bacteroidaceae bacterium]